MNESINQSINQSINPDVLSSGPGLTSLSFLVFCPCIWSLTFSHLHMFSFSLFQPLVDVTRNISFFQNKMNFLFYLSFSFSYVKMWDLLRKRKVKNHLFNSTLYDRHNAVQVCGSYGMTRYESFTHTAQPRIIRRIFTSSAVRILNFIRHCFAYRMNDNTTRMVRR